MKRAAASAWSIGRLPRTLAPRGCGSGGCGRSGFDAALGVIEAAAVTDDGIGIVLGPQLGMQHGTVVVGLLACSAHALAPFRISAMWMNFIGTPMRSAQPC